jgi:hypothetical protein
MKSSNKYSIYKNLFNDYELKSIRNYYHSIYQRNKNNINDIFEFAINKSDFYPGFYFLIYNKENDSWLRETRSLNKHLQNNSITENILIDNEKCTYKKIKFNHPNKIDYSYAFVVDVSHKKEVQKNINNVIDILKDNNFNILDKSVSLTVQESGHTIHEHKDAGVGARYHVVLNDDVNDYFYIENTGYKLNFGDCIYVNTSQINHTYMHFNDEIRMHMIFDVE